MKTYHLQDDYDDVTVTDGNVADKDKTWYVISWLEGFLHPPATRVVALFNETKYAQALELYDRSQF